MSLITEQVKELLNDPSSVKVISTLNEDGTIHTVPKGSLRVKEGDVLEYAEILESSQSYKNAVRTLWFDKSATVLVVGADRKSCRLKCSVERVLISGREFEEAYRRYYEQRGFYIAAIVRLKVESVTDLDVKKEIERQKKERFFFTHLDQLVKEDAA